MARLLGYEIKRPQPPDAPAGDQPNAISDHPSGQGEIPPEQPKRLADVAFWRLEEVAQLSPTTPEEDGGNQSPPETLQASYMPGDPARPRPLAAWRDLMPRLRQAAAERTDSRVLDVDAIVRRIGQGRVLDRLPCRTRTRWGDRLQIIEDRSHRLVPYWTDQDQLAADLERQFPRHAVEHARLLEAAAEPVMLDGRAAFGRYRWPSPGTFVVALGDLGCLQRDSSDQARAWASFGRRLRDTGCRLAAIMPCPRRRWSRLPRRSWQLVEWERPRSGSGRRTTSDSERAERLLTLISPAVRIEPGFLRAVRLLLGSDGADAGTEADVWQHPVVSPHPVAATLHHETSRRLRQQFAEEPELLRRGVIQLLRAWRASRPSEIFYEEIVNLDADDAKRHVDPAELGNARMFVNRIAQHISGEGHFAPSAGMLAWGRRFAQRLTETACSDNAIEAAVHRLCGALLRDDPDWTPPAVVDPSRIPATGSRRRRFEIRHRGGEVVLAPSKAFTSEPDRSGSWLAPIDSRNCLIGVAAASVENNASFWKSGVPPSWAHDWGTDDYGPWVTFAVPSADGTPVTQRLRWIPPGTFLMGSPEEPERWDEEGPQHAATISRGFWLADTACTQALWQAVTGENPSAFKGDERPVEQVSWDDVQGFLARLDERLPGLGLRLPSEAEWEYACRAGTTTPFSFGATITPEQVNYAGGETGPFRRETVPVASLPANPWGLYEMHGNVWEWCADGQRRYSNKAVTDPMGRTEAGAGRVLRGGSWSYVARFVRSASRYWFGPGYRDGSVGFRCARVQEGAEPRGAEAGRAGAGRQAERRTASDRPGAAAALLRLDGERPQAAGPLPDAPAIIVRSDCESLTLRRITRPEWASAIGRDRFGLWAEFEVAAAAVKPSTGKRSRRSPKSAPAASPGKPVVQRLRWIPPGRFLMGSPDSEPGRFEVEGPQHEVRLGQGFWLADTPCTQALWQAVMGDNPSEFKSADRPVEQVSWNEVQGFLGGVNERIPGLDLALPSEAQWEYACRAGTASAIYAGDLSIVGERNAPALDPIAWYGGNSGQGFDLPNGYGSADWPEKQYPHTRAGTRPVRLKAPNDWGLYDMLGNVWEWCADPWHDRYNDAPADGSIWQDAAAAGAGRVLRGGSWSAGARGVRSAYRLWVVPGSRRDYFGFRCARVQS